MLISTCYGLQMERLHGAPLYFVAEGGVRSQTGRVHIVKKIEIGGLFNGIDGITTHIADAMKLGNNSEMNIELEEVRMELAEGVNTLRRNADKLSQLAGGKIRTRRGLLDIVGEGLKFLFGTMSASDAKEIAKEIKYADNNQDTIEQQIGSTVAILNKINAANLVIKQNQRKEEAAVNEMWEQLGNYMSQEEAREDIREIHNQLSRWIYTLKLEVDEMHSALMFLKAGVVDPYILDIGEIKVNADTMGQGYEINVDSINDLQGAANISTFINSTSKTIFVAVSLPVAGNSTLDLYSVNRIPQLIGGQRMIIERASTFLLIAADKRSYWQGDNLKHVRVGDTVIIDRLPMMALRGNASCEATVFQFMTDTRCQYKKWEKELEVEVVTNGYLISSFEESNVSYVCSKEKGVFTINEPMVVLMEEGCAVSGDGFAIEGATQDRKITLQDLAIRVDCCSIFDTNRPEPMPSGNVSLDFVNITDVGIQLWELKNSLLEYRSKQIEPLMLFGVPVGVVLIMAGIILTIWYVRITRGRAIVDMVVEQGIIRNQQEMELRNYG